MTSDFLVDYPWLITDEDGVRHRVRASGTRRADDSWDGFLQFTSEAGVVAHVSHETTQLDRSDLVYWADGLTRGHLDDALSRACERRGRRNSGIVPRSSAWEELANAEEDEETALPVVARARGT